MRQAAHVTLQWIAPLALGQEIAERGKQFRAELLWALDERPFDLARGSEKNRAQAQGP